jgi:NADP-dependent 3-hydroxy acid dehydrogenase YdfG
MVRTLRKKVVAIPLAVTPIGSAVAKLVAAQQGGLALGAPSLGQIKALETGNDGRYGVYAQQVDLDRPKSVAEFFKIAIGQFGRLDVIVLETIKSPVRNAGLDKVIELSTRRLLHCLDAALECAESDLHVISIAPVVGRVAIPVATAFLGAKLATSNSVPPPRLRMSLVSPFDGQILEDGSLARTVLHVMKEQRSPDITELVLRPPPIHGDREQKQLNGRSKMWVQM